MEQNMEDKRRYSYFIVKPDGIKFFPEIVEVLKQTFKDNVSIRYFKIDEFDEIIKKLYYKHFENKEGFAESFEDYLIASKSIYGNKGILILLSNSVPEQYIQFMEDIMKVKMKIRDRFVNPDVCAITNNPRTDKKNKVVISDKSGKTVKQRNFTQYGNYRISDFNVIHCPDPRVEDTNKELGILIKSGVITDKNMFDPQAMMEVLRFKTLEGYKEEYREQRPDIAGFIRRDMSDSIGDNEK